MPSRRSVLVILVLALGLSGSVCAQETKLPAPDSTNANAPPQRQDVSKQVQDPNSRLNDLQQRIDHSEKYLSLLNYVATVIVAFATVLSVVVFFFGKEKAEQAVSKVINRANEVRKQLEDRVIAIQRQEDKLQERQSQLEKHFADLQDLRSQLDAQHMSMLSRIPQEIVALRQSLTRALDDHAVSDAATLYRFYAQLSQKQRQLILLGEFKVPTLLLLSTSRSVQADKTAPGNQEASLVPEPSKEWSAILRGLGIFYAGKAYDKGSYELNEDFLKACFYFRYAIDLDATNVFAWNDLGAVLLSVVDNSPDHSYCLEAKQVLLKTLEIARPHLQRTYCNLTWAYLGLDQPDEAWKQVAGDILALPFLKPDGDPMPEMVYLMRCLSLIRLNRMQEAYFNQRDACRKFVPDVKRLIDEESSGALKPLLDDPEWGPQAREVLRKYGASE